MTGLRGHFGDRDRLNVLGSVSKYQGNPMASDQEPLTEPQNPLPPVEPPSASFLLQLFVIPMVIVTIIVMVWLMLNWLAHMGSNPQHLVRDLHKLNDASWQKALTLADLLRNPDYDHLKSDPEMADELAAILTQQLDSGSNDEKPIRLRMFLCRALGEFRTPTALPPLLAAAAHERDLRDIDVRRAALEAIAVFATHSDQSELPHREQVMDVLRAASRERADGPEERIARSEIRSTAAYALGVVGGPEATDRLELMLSDAYANTRYNAALGLVRHGDVRATPILLEMLDPANRKSAESEEHEGGRASKRLMVITNGIRGAAELAENNTVDDLAPIVAALQGVVDSDLELFPSRSHSGIRIKAEEVLIALRGR